MSAATEEQTPAPAGQPSEDAALRATFPEFYQEPADGERQADAPEATPDAAREAPPADTDTATDTDPPARERDEAGRFKPREAATPPAEEAPPAEPATPPEAAATPPEAPAVAHLREQFAALERQVAEREALWERQRQSYLGEIRNAANRTRDAERQRIRAIYQQAGDYDSLAHLDRLWADEDRQQQTQEQLGQVPLLQQQLQEVEGERQADQWERQVEERVRAAPTLLADFVRHHAVPALKARGVDAEPDAVLAAFQEGENVARLQRAIRAAEEYAIVGKDRREAYSVVADLAAAFTDRAADRLAHGVALAAKDREIADLKEQVEVAANRSAAAGTARHRHDDGGASGTAAPDLDDLVKAGDTDAVTRRIFAEYYPQQ